MTVTRLHPQVEQPRHYADCDSLWIGRRVKALILDNTRDCSCFALQLTRVEADLKARRAGQAAGFHHELEIAALLTARETLRAVMSRVDR